MNLILRGARLADDRIVDIGIANGAIVALAKTLPQSSETELILDGRLTIPAFVNGQLHACKSFWRRLLSQLPTEVRALPRFEVAQHVKQLYTAKDVFARVDEAMRLAIQHGTCAIRLFADVDDACGLNAINGLLEIRAKYESIMTVQVVAFAQDGILDKSTQRLMRQALELGADVVGGIPWIEPTAKLQQAHVTECFQLAKDFDRDLHFVCDDVIDPDMRTVEIVARQTMANDYRSRVSVTQCAALSAYPDDYQTAIVNLIKDADLNIFSNSHVSLIATGFDTRQPWPRAIAPVRQLLAAGIAVACAQDDIDNWYYPFGRNDMLEVAQFMAHVGQFAWHDDVDQLLPMVTTTPARVLGLTNHGIYVGEEANLVVLEASDWHEALQFQADKSFVILRGRLVSQMNTQVDFSMG